MPIRIIISVALGVGLVPFVLMANIVDIKATLVLVQLIALGVLIKERRKLL